MICSDEMTVYRDDKPIVLIIAGEVFWQNNELTVEQLEATRYSDGEEFQLNTAETLRAMDKLITVFHSPR